MESAEQRRLVVNVDALWGGEPRWYRVGDVSLGDRGIPQAVVFYALAGMLVAWVASAVPGLSMGWMPGGLAVVVAFTAAGFVRPGGLRAHVFIPIALGHALAAKHLHGWSTCRSPLGEWRPEELPLEPDGSQAHFRALRFTGPGLVVRHRPAQRLRVAPSVRQRLAGRPPAQALVEHAGRAPLAEPRELWVPEGSVLIVREGQA